MNKRDKALAMIEVEHARHGEATYMSTRAYIENRISRGEYDKAAQAGMKIYRASVDRADTLDGIAARAKEAME